MEQKKEPYYLGIDFNHQYAMISYYQLHMNEPETVATIAGSEIYQIPQVLAKKKNLGQWYYGDEARRLAKSGDIICVDSILKRAVNGETIRMENETFQGEELLLLFLRKILLLPQKLGKPVDCDRIVVTMEKLDRRKMDLFWGIAEKLGLDRDRFMVIDHKESFYYFVLNQQKELWLHQVCLFEYEEGKMRSYTLSRNPKTTPQLVSIGENPGEKLVGEKDLAFYHILQNALENKIVSTAYLVGDGFEGNWMKSSLQFLCRGRRAFMGNNLFSKGACYAARIRDQEEEWPFVYMGENEMKFNVSLKVKNGASMEFLTLISAGKNWFEISGKCEVILSGNHEIEFWKQLPNSREAVIESLDLTDLPKRPDRTTRVAIMAKPVSDVQVDIEIRDLGFGEIFQSTHKVWKYTMTM